MENDLFQVYKAKHTEKKKGDFSMTVYKNSDGDHEAIKPEFEQLKSLAENTKFFDLIEFDLSEGENAAFVSSMPNGGTLEHYLNTVRADAETTGKSAFINEPQLIQMMLDMADSVQQIQEDGHSHSHLCFESF